MIVSYNEGIVEELESIAYEYMQIESFSVDSFKKYTLKKLLRLASDGIFNFSDRPLKLTSTFGVTVSIVSALMMFALIIQRIL